MQCVSKKSETGKLVGFRSNTQGALMGYEHRLGPFSVGSGVGYDHTYLGWKGSTARGKAHRAYGALYGSFTHQIVAIDIALLGGANFYDLTRKIFFSALGRPNATTSATPESTDRLHLLSSWLV